MPIPRNAISIPVLLAVALAGCSGDGGETVAQKPAAPAYAEEEALFTLPPDAVVETKVNRTGTAAAFWIQLEESVLLAVTGHEPREYTGYINYQEQFDSWQAVRPMGELAVFSVGESAKEGTYLQWSPLEGNEEHIALDDSGEHVAFTAYHEGDWCIFVDFAPGPPFAWVSAPVISAEGGTVAYVAAKEGKQTLVVNQVPGPWYEKVYPSSIRLGPRGEHVFYMAQDGDGFFAVFDGVENERFEALSNEVALGPDGSRYAYHGMRGEQWCTVLDGEPGPLYDQTGGFVFSEDGEHFAYAAQQDERWRFVVDGVEQPAHDQVSRRFLFDADGRRHAYAAQDGDRWLTVVDGRPGRPCDAVLGFAFSGGGKHCLVLEKDGERRRAILDGEERAELAPGGEVAMPPIFSPDGKEVLYVVRRDDRLHVVVNGSEGPALDAIGWPVYTEDGSRRLFNAEQGGQNTFCLAGAAQDTFDAVLSQIAANYRDHYACWIQQGGKYHMLVDGDPGAGYDEGYLTEERSLAFRDDGSLRFIARRDSNVVRVSLRP